MVLTRGSILRVGLFLIVVVALWWYVVSKRVDFRDSQPEVLPTTAPVEVAIEESNFLVDFRLDRERARSEQKEILKDVMTQPGWDESTRKEANQRLLQLVETVAQEMEIENLIRARGFEDALVFINNGSATIIVKAQSLTAAQAAQIADAAMRTTGIKRDRISIQTKTQ